MHKEKKYWDHSQMLIINRIEHTKNSHRYNKTFLRIKRLKKLNHLLLPLKCPKEHFENIAFFNQHTAIGTHTTLCTFFCFFNIALSFSQ